MSGKVAGVKYVVYNFKCGEEKLFLPRVEIGKDVKLFPLILTHFSMGQCVSWSKCSIPDKAIVREKLLL